MVKKHKKVSFKKDTTNKKTFLDKYKLYECITKVPNNLRNHILKHLDDDSINDVCECLYNVVFTDLNLSKQKKQLLRQHIKKSIPDIELLTNRGMSVSKRRQALSQQGKGIGLILSAILPFLTKLFIK